MLARCYRASVPSLSISGTLLQEAEQRRPGDDRVSDNDGAKGVETEQVSGTHAAKDEGGGSVPHDKTSGKKTQVSTNGGGGGESLVGSLELGKGGGETAPPSCAPEAQVDAKAEKRARNTEKRGEAGGGLSGDNGDTRPEQPQVKKRKKGRLVPGSLVLTSVSASDLPDTEKGVFSKQVCPQSSRDCTQPPTIERISLQDSKI